MRTICLYTNKNEWAAIQLKNPLHIINSYCNKIHWKIRELFSIVEKNIFWGLSVRLTHLSEYKITTRVIGKYDRRTEFRFPPVLQLSLSLFRYESICSPSHGFYMLDYRVASSLREGKFWIRKPRRNLNISTPFSFPRAYANLQIIKKINLSRVLIYKHLHSEWTRRLTNNDLCLKNSFFNFDRKSFYTNLLI